MGSEVGGQKAGGRKAVSLPTACLGLKRPPTVAAIFHHRRHQQPWSQEPKPERRNAEPSKTTRLIPKDSPPLLLHWIALDTNSHAASGYNPNSRKQGCNVVTKHTPQSQELPTVAAPLDQPPSFPPLLHHSLSPPPYPPIPVTIPRSPYPPHP